MEYQKIKFKFCLPKIDKEFFPFKILHTPFLAWYRDKLYFVFYSKMVLIGKAVTNG